MDGQRFDHLAKLVAQHRLSRRAALRVVGGLAAVLGTGRSARETHAQAATPTASPATPTGVPLTVRKNAKDLSRAEKTAFVDAVLAIKQKPSPWVPGLSVYDTFALWHRDAFNCDINAAHMGPAFFPWHRAFVLVFEQQLQAVDPTVAVPYWDWAVDQGPDAYLWGDDLMGGDGDPSQGHAVTTGPFRKGAWELVVFDHGDQVRAPYVIRDLGAGKLAPTLPTAAEVAAALEIATYDAPPWNAMSPIAQSFRNTLEGWRDCVVETCDPVDGLSPTCTGSHDLHNRVHLWVAGEFAFSHEEAMSGHGATGTPAATPVGVDPLSPAGNPDIMGTMAANSSPNDPVFFLHHANIDRIWSEWLRRHGPNYEPVGGGPVGHNLDDAMWPYAQIGLTMTPRMMLESRALGYVYDAEG